MKGDTLVENVIAIWKQSAPQRSTSASSPAEAPSEAWTLSYQRCITPFLAATPEEAVEASASLTPPDSVFVTEDLQPLADAVDALSEARGKRPAPFPISPSPLPRPHHRTNLRQEEVVLRLFGKLLTAAAFAKDNDSALDALDSLFLLVSGCIYKHVKKIKKMDKLPLNQACLLYAHLGDHFAFLFLEALDILIAATRTHVAHIALGFPLPQLALKADFASGDHSDAGGGVRDRSRDGGEGGEGGEGGGGGEGGEGVLERKIKENIRKLIEHLINRIVSTPSPFFDTRWSVLAFCDVKKEPWTVVPSKYPLSQLMSATAACRRSAGEVPLSWITLTHMSAVLSSEVMDAYVNHGSCKVSNLLPLQAPQVHNRPRQEAPFPAAQKLKPWTLTRHCYTLEMYSLLREDVNAASSILTSLFYLAAGDSGHQTRPYDINRPLLLGHDAGHRDREMKNVFETWDKHAMDHRWVVKHLWSLIGHFLYTSSDGSQASLLEGPLPAHLNGAYVTARTEPSTPLVRLSCLRLLRQAIAFFPKVILRETLLDLLDCHMMLQRNSQWVSPQQLGVPQIGGQLRQTQMAALEQNLQSMPLLPAVAATVQVPLFDVCLQTLPPLGTDGAPAAGQGTLGESEGGAAASNLALTATPGMALGLGAGASPLPTKISGTVDLSAVASLTTPKCWTFLPQHHLGRNQLPAEVLSESSVASLLALAISHEVVDFDEVWARLEPSDFVLGTVAEFQRLAGLVETDAVRAGKLKGEFIQSLREDEARRVSSAMNGGGSQERDQNRESEIEKFFPKLHTLNSRQIATMIKNATGSKVDLIVAFLSLNLRPLFVKAHERMKNYCRDFPYHTIRAVRRAAGALIDALVIPPRVAPPVESVESLGVGSKAVPAWQAGLHSTESLGDESWSPLHSVSSYLAAEHTLIRPFQGWADVSVATHRRLAELVASHAQTLPVGERLRDESVKLFLLQHLLPALLLMPVPNALHRPSPLRSGHPSLPPASAAAIPEKQQRMPHTPSVSTSFTTLLMSDAGSSAETSPTLQMSEVVYEALVECGLTASERHELYAAFFLVELRKSPLNAYSALDRTAVMRAMKQITAHDTQQSTTASQSTQGASGQLGLGQLGLGLGAAIEGRGGGFVGGGGGGGTLNAGGRSLAAVLANAPWLQRLLASASPREKQRIWGKRELEVASVISRQAVNNPLETFDYVLSSIENYDRVIIDVTLEFLTSVGRLTADVITFLLCERQQNREVLEGGHWAPYLPKPLRLRNTAYFAAKLLRRFVWMSPSHLIQSTLMRLKLEAAALPTPTTTTTVSSLATSLITKSNAQFPLRLKGYFGDYVYLQELLTSVGGVAFVPLREMTAEQVIALQVGPCLRCLLSEDGEGLESLFGDVGGRLENSTPSEAVRAQRQLLAALVRQGGLRDAVFLLSKFSQALSYAADLRFPSTVTPIAQIKTVTEHVDSLDSTVDHLLEFVDSVNVQTTPGASDMAIESINAYRVCFPRETWKSLFQSLSHALAWRIIRSTLDIKFQALSRPASPPTSESTPTSNSLQQQLWSGEDGSLLPQIVYEGVPLSPKEILEDADPGCDSEQTKLPEDFVTAFWLSDLEMIIHVPELYIEKTAALTNALHLLTAASRESLTRAAANSLSARPVPGLPSSLSSRRGEALARGTTGQGQEFSMGENKGMKDVDGEEVPQIRLMRRTLAALQSECDDREALSLRTRAWLKSIFTRAFSSSSSADFDMILSQLIFPRAMQTPKDAIYCAYFLSALVCRELESCSDSEARDARAGSGPQTTLLTSRVTCFAMAAAVVEKFFPCLLGTTDLEAENLALFLRFYLNDLELQVCLEKEDKRLFRLLIEESVLKSLQHSPLFISASAEPNNIASDADSALTKSGDANSGGDEEGSAGLWCFLHRSLTVFNQCHEDLFISESATLSLRRGLTRLAKDIDKEWRDVLNLNKALLRNLTPTGKLRYSVPSSSPSAATPTSANFGSMGLGEGDTVGNDVGGNIGDRPRAFSEAVTSLKARIKCIMEDPAELQRLRLASTAPAAAIAYDEAAFEAPSLALRGPANAMMAHQQKSSEGAMPPVLATKVTSAGKGRLGVPQPSAGCREDEQKAAENISGKGLGAFTTPHESRSSGATTPNDEQQPSQQRAGQQLRQQQQQQRNQQHQQHQPQQQISVSSRSPESERTDNERRSEKGSGKENEKGREKEREKEREREREREKEYGKNKKNETGGGRDKDNDREKAPGRDAGWQEAGGRKHSEASSDGSRGKRSEGGAGALAGGRVSSSMPSGTASPSPTTFSNGIGILHLPRVVAAAPVASGTPRNHANVRNAIPSMIDSPSKTVLNSGAAGKGGSPLFVVGQKGGYKPSSSGSERGDVDGDRNSFGSGSRGSQEKKQERDDGRYTVDHGNGSSHGTVNSLAPPVVITRGGLVRMQPSADAGDPKRRRLDSAASSTAFGNGFNSSPPAPAALNSPTTITPTIIYGPGFLADRPFDRGREPPREWLRDRDRERDRDRDRDRLMERDWERGRDRDRGGRGVGVGGGGGVEGGAADRPRDGRRLSRGIAEDDARGDIQTRDRSARRRERESLRDRERARDWERERDKDRDRDRERERGPMRDQDPLREREPWGNEREREARERERERDRERDGDRDRGGDREYRDDRRIEEEYDRWMRNETRSRLLRKD